MRHLLAATMLLLLSTAVFFGGRAGPSLSLGGAAAALARDDGRYAQSPHKPWFDSLKNRNGMGCCSDADGVKLDDPEWQCEHSQQCSVRLDGVWREVPPDAILDANNIVGYAMVWRTTDSQGVVRIICFLRGTEI